MRAMMAALLLALAAWPAAAEEAPRRWVAELRLAPRIAALAALPEGALDAAAALETRGEALALAALRLGWGAPGASLHLHAEMAPRWPGLAGLAALEWRLDERAALGAYELARESAGRLGDAIPGGALLARWAAR
jgi:hypothetical protein